MSNIHSLHTLSYDQQDNDFTERFLLQEGVLSPETSFWELLFPNLTLKRFILWMSCVQTGCFVMTLIYGSSSLQPTIETLILFGAAHGKLIRQGEVWRLILPLFLHVSIWHLFFNIFFQLRIAPTIEKEKGLILFCLIYFVSGLAGVLFSVALSPCSVSVGASTAGFSLIGLTITEIALTWNSIANKQEVLFSIIWFVLLCLISVGAPGSTVDWRGHIGGFMAGIAFALAFSHVDLSPTLCQHRWLNVNILGYLILACLIIVPFCILFFTPSTQLLANCPLLP